MAEVKNIFDIAGRAMAAQMVRLNTISVSYTHLTLPTKRIV